MSNHYHFLVETPEANLTKAMHDLNSGYVNWYRNKYKLIGSIFQGRYRAIVVEEDEIMSRKKGNPYRKLFVYMLRKFRGMSLREIGEMMGMDYGAVSELARYFSREVEKKTVMRKKVERDVRRRILV